MPGLKDQNSSKNTAGEVENTSRAISEISIEDLSGRICYFSLSGDQALKAYEENALSSIQKLNKKRKRLKDDVTNRLYFAIVMFDKVVMHCSDPLRSEIVLEILENHQQWIKDGRILFVFSNHIKDIRKDYQTYIDEKKAEYSGEENSQKEADSLSQDYMTEEYYKRVIDILSYSAYLVRKPTNLQYSFPFLVEEDLKKASENIIVEWDSHLNQIPVFGLTLSQLLHIKRLSKDGRSCAFIFPTDIIDGDGGVVESIRECLGQKTPIARSAIVDMIRKGFKEKGIKPNPLQKRVLKAIALRMDVLYCRMNCGNQFILEFHPLFEGNSIYNESFFLQYISQILKGDTIQELNYETINSIINMHDLKYLRYGYLACMADIIERQNIFHEQEILLANVFLGTIKRNEIFADTNL